MSSSASGKLKTPQAASASSTSQKSEANAQVKPLVLSAATVARAQTLLSAAAFLSAFVVGSALHYKKIVKNGVAAYPDEWLPSVSATIGDWYPERNIFQILIALTASPRFAILILTYYLNKSKALFFVGILRTLSCGGWVYVTSSDDGLAHDVLMIAYIVLNIPWMVGNILLSQGRNVRRRRSFLASAFFGALVPLVYFYIQHKVHRIPGAYSYYAIFEWSLIIFDVIFDSISEKELKEAGTTITLGPLGTDKDAVMESSKSVKEKSDKSLKTFSSAGQCGAGLSFASDLYLSYVFWSNLTGLIPSLFYFSVWELGIAGQELALLSLLSPIFLGAFSSLGSLLSSRTGQTVAYIIQFSSLFAFYSGSPFNRLIIVTFSCVVMMQRETVLLSGLVRGEGPQSGKPLGYWGVVTTLGFIVSSLSKHANHGNNPIWPFIDPKNGGYNKIGLLFAALALLEFALRPTPPSLAAPSSSSKTQQKPAKQSRPSVFLNASVPLGSLLFTLHNLFADPSSIVAASWTGWEHGAPRGPLPHIHGSITMVTMSLGLLLGVAGLSYSSTRGKKNPFLSVPWFLLGAAGTYGMYKERNWEGYGSSLVLALVIFSAAPAIFVKAAQASRASNDDREGSAIAKESSGQIAKTWTGAMFVYILLNLASIFTVAYAFVPGGWVFRERTDAVLTAQIVCLAFAFNWPGLASASSKVSFAITGIAPSGKKAAYTALALVSSLATLSTLYRTPVVAPTPYQPAGRIVNAGIWTVHFGINNEGHDSQRGMRDLIRDMELDIVGLLETDLHRTAYGHRDLTRVMLEDIGYNVDIGPGPNSHTWGAVLLTKFPIINTTHHLLPSPGGELAPAIEAVLDIYGTETTVIVSHNGQEEDPLDRELQSTELARIMKASPRPVIFLGYVVTKPHAPRPNPYEILVKDGNVHDIDDEDHDRWCEYILYRGVHRTAYARVSRGIITDTELQIGQFVVPPPNETITDDSRESRYIRAFQKDLPKSHWFPAEYLGNVESGGKNGHFYHVFNQPLYYKIPKQSS
ncbi:hypothetical protein FA15DRAFT_673223 [Coprinopsis marcescibilis]|uniref:Calcofluor white hypersensitive protein n=1 Tax=Coprinopsis marcescibilis TaxID=230819 RepID=A0A5C3KK37_COPMA|nr:hypothetical protein FA15DRAFT_673223 [Coprinopsis marcescibilis]